MQEKVTFDDVYEIAAEVAEETVKRFLSNLVKLVPQAEAVVDDIREEQYEELRQLRQGKLQEQRIARPIPNRNATPARRSDPIIPMNESSDDSFYDDADDEFAQIAHPVTNNVSNPLNIDDALSQIPLEKSDLFGAAANSDVVDDAVVPMEGLDA